jgi:hypothetical protein
VPVTQLDVRQYYNAFILRGIYSHLTMLPSDTVKSSLLIRAGEKYRQARRLIL